MKQIINLLGFLLLLFISGTAQADSGRYAEKSVLSEGKWVKIRVEKEGIFKLTHAALKSMGFSDPSKVSVHGYGGWILEEDFRKDDYIDDLPATAVYRGDNYLLFYGRGPIKWTHSYNTKEKFSSFSHTNNPYSTHGYYFLTDAAEPKEMSKKPSTSGGAKLSVSTFDDYYLHEVDRVSINQSGRELFGESFTGSLPQKFSVSIPGITNDPGRVNLRFVSLPKGSSGTVRMSIDKDEVLSSSISNYAPEGTVGNINSKQSEIWTGDKTASMTVTITYGQSNHQNVYLDYFRLQMKRELKSYGPHTFFRYIQSVGNDVEYLIRDAHQNMLVFDVTDPINPQVVETTFTDGVLSFSAKDNSLHEYALVDPTKTLLTPEKEEDIANQNLHSLGQTDMVIIAPKAFTAEAERLANAHREIDGMTVAVVRPELIYNEFSSGTPDATAYRRFMKMFYDRGLNPKHLLLMGDGSYDNRGVTDAWKNTNLTNFLLTFQSQASLGYDSYVTDDYFAFLDDNEGGLDGQGRDRLLGATMDIGVGRFPARTVSEARIMVDKTIAYLKNVRNGVWKNRVSFVADDGNTADKYTIDHMKHANILASSIENKHPEFIIDKQFFDTYKKGVQDGITTYPDVIKNIQSSLKEGLLLINYNGHGNPTSWADEKVLRQSDIKQFTYKNLPLWITATCDFGPFDATSTSAGEDVALLPNSGGVGIISTTRVVYRERNFNLSQDIIKNLFERNSNNQPLSFGEALRLAKNKDAEDVNKLKFVLLADPALALSRAEYRTKLTEINGQTVNQSDTLTFKALDKITLKGEITSFQGDRINDFNGLITARILDSKVDVKTLDNNGVGAFEYQDYKGVLYNGTDSVRNGQFTFTFTVPKDISYSGNAGKMSFYAVSASSGNKEAQGYFQSFKVGGSNPNPEQDTEGPEIRRVFLNDTTFTDGGTVNTTPFFVAELWDKTGINTTGSSIGHDITLTIDNDPYRSYVLNNYYAGIVGKSGEGIVKFPIPALKAGEHTAVFKVWDILNNSSEDTIRFVVQEGLKPFIFELFATPIPAREQVTFSINHNRPESALDVTIQVFDMTGRLVWQRKERGSSDYFNAYQVVWDLRDGSGGRLRPGVFLYRAYISSDNSKEATKAKKLIILAQ